MERKKLSFQSNRSTIISLLLFLSICVVGFVLRVARTVLIPLGIAMLLAVLSRPIAYFLDTLRIPKLVSVLLIIAVILSLGVLFGVIFFAGIQTLLEDLPELQEVISELSDLVLAGAARIFEGFEFEGDVINTRELLGQLSSLVVSVSNASFEVLRYFGLTLFFLFFILLEIQSIQGGLQKALEGNPNRVGYFVVLRRIYKSVFRYASIKLLISLLTSVLVLIVCLSFSVPNALLWMILTFLFNFIPYIGSILISGIISIYAFSQFTPNYPVVIAVAALVSSIQLVLGNIIEPKVMGDQLNLNPFFILLALVSWGLMWDIAGMFLAVPLTMCIKIVLSNTNALSRLGVFMERKN